MEKFNMKNGSDAIADIITIAVILIILLNSI